VLFVCVRNSGKSQMAAGLLQRIAGDRLYVSSAGTQAGTDLNALSVQSLAEVGVDIADQHTRQLTDQLQDAANLVITVGGDAQVPHRPGTRYQLWDIDEPSRRGIDGLDRMRLVRDDIDRHVRALAAQLTHDHTAAADVTGLAGVMVVPLAPQHWPDVQRIYAAGIAQPHEGEPAMTTTAADLLPILALLRQAERECTAHEATWPLTRWTTRGSGTPMPCWCGSLSRR